MDHGTTAVFQNLPPETPIIRRFLRSHQAEHGSGCSAEKTAAPYRTKKVCRLLTSSQGVARDGPRDQTRPTSTSYTAWVPAAMPKPRMTNRIAKNMPASVRKVKL